MRLYFGVRSPIRRTVLLVRLADVESGEPAHRDVLLQLRDVLRDQVLDRVLRLSKVWLLQEDVLLDEVLDLPIDPLGEGLRRGAVLLGFALVARPLLGPSRARRAWPPWRCLSRAGSCRPCRGRLRPPRARPCSR